jgi:hypothetical protein
MREAEPHMKIVPLNGLDGLSEFIEFPRTVYGGDPTWIPPLREQQFFELSGASAFSRYGTFRLFLCEAEGRIAGRIAALINPRLDDGSGRPFGQLGYFECVDDSRVAGALIDAGVDWLKAQQVQTVLGPMNGGAHRAHRFLTRGFDREPYLFEPRNPPYYPSLFERNGFAPVHRWYGYELSADRAAQRAGQLRRVLDRRPASVELEALPLEQPEQVIARLHPLLDRCWAGHPGYASLDIDEFAEVLGGALSIMSPGNLRVLRSPTGDAGFAFVYPDYSHQMRALNGSAAGWGRWLGTAVPTRIVLSTAAVIPEARQSSAATAIMAWAFGVAAAEGYTQAIMSLVVEGFLSKTAEPTREHTLYARRIA